MRWAVLGPIPGIGFRSGMFSRPPGATSGHNRSNAFGHRSLWKYLADSYSGEDPAEVEDDVHNDRLQSMRNVTKDEFHEAIPDYHEGPKGKPLSKDLHNALTEYYHTHSRPEKQAAGGMWGKAMNAVAGVASGAKSLARSPQSVGREAMLAARRNIPEVMQNHVTKYQNKMFDSLRRHGVNQNEAAGFAQSSFPTVTRGNHPLRAVGQNAAQGQLAKQIGVYGGGAALASGVNSQIGQPQAQPIVNPAMHNLFKTVQPAPTATGMIKAHSAREFGQKVAFNIDWNMLKNPTIGGAALGAVAGGVHGLINPGEDEHGRQRNRFGAMLRGALGGGALGTAGGAAIGHFAPNLPQDIYNFGRRTLTGKNQAQLNMGDNVSAMTPKQQALHARAMQPFRKPKSITEQFPEEISFPQQQ